MKHVMLILGLVFSFGCVKESDLVAVGEPITYRDVVAKKYDEMACIVDNKAGIRCFESLGKTCKKEKSCTPLDSLSAAQFFSAQEIANWPNVNLDTNTSFKYHMWEIDWFIHPDDDN